jgi:hypothetical protein
MEIEVYRRVGSAGFDYDLSAIFDGWQSLIVTKNYYACDQFELVIPLSATNVGLFQVDTCLLINGEYFFVNTVTCDDLETAKLKVSGQSLAGKYSDRIINRVYSVNKKPESIVYDHFNMEMVAPSDTNRKFTYLTLAALTAWSNANIQYQRSYDTVEKAVEDLFETYNFGFTESATSSIAVGNTITIYKGQDLSNVVEISVEFENLLNEGFESNTTDYKTTAFVFGEGDGAARKSVAINASNAGIERRELYVDARDLQQTTDDGTLTDAQYNAALTSRGNEKLAEQQKVLTLSGELNMQSKLFTFGVDYGLGDTVKIKSKTFGVSKTATITSVKYTYDHTGEYIEPIFGKESPTVFDILKRK